MKASLDVVFATYSKLPDGDPDDLIALDVLRSRGLKVGVADWRKVAGNELDSRLVLLRSTWDYNHHYKEFLDWVELVSANTKLRNDAETVRWNSDKRYLFQLASAGIRIVPGVLVERADGLKMEEADLDQYLKRSELAGYESIIIKPSVGLSTYGVKRFKPISVEFADIASHIRGLSQSSDVLIQPFLTEVEKYGERALVFINGEFSHAIRKRAFQIHATAGNAGETAVQASEEEISFGRDVIARLLKLRGCAVPLYARVDVVPDDNGAIMLLELELIEPSLFLKFDEGAGQRFAEAIAALLD